ncbi:MAG: hypothetical protein ACYDIC_16645 [Desulfobaccales bacterium]
MKNKKTAALSSDLVAIKGKAAAALDAESRGSKAESADSGIAKLNFAVSPEFRKRFRQRAAGADLKLNELLRQALEAWEEKHGL